MSLPKDAQTRKGIPIYSGFVKYFPDAMAAVAQLSRIANEQHNPGEPMHWAKEKSTDELDALMRHMVDDVTAEPRDEEGVLHVVKLAWRAMANLQRLADSGVDIFASLPEVDADGGTIPCTGCGVDLTRADCRCVNERVTAEMYDAVPDEAWCATCDRSWWWCPCEAPPPATPWRAGLEHECPLVTCTWETCTCRRV